MATKGKGDITAHGGGFDVGEKVGLTERHGDNFLEGLPTQATTTVQKDGAIVFKDQPFGTYWIHRLEERDGNFAALTYHHKERGPGAEKPSPEEAQKRLDATRPSSRAARMVTGPVGTGNVAVGRHGLPFAASAGGLGDSTGLRAPGDYLAHEDDREKAVDKWTADEHVKGSPVGEPTPKELRDPNEASPRLAQEDAQKVVQRSATITGEAHPNDPDEPLPKPSQEQVPAKQLQRSATPRGEAAPIPDEEASPRPRQEDARGLVQRSATPTGEATPKPVTKEPATTEIRESSRQKAIGHAPQQVGNLAVSEEKPAEVVEPGDEGREQSASADQKVVATGDASKPQATEKEAKALDKGKDALEVGGKGSPQRDQKVKVDPKPKQADGADTVRKGTAKNVASKKTGKK